LGYRRLPGPGFDEDAMAALHKAMDCGVNFLDTADVYGNGRSEQRIAKLRKRCKQEIVVATKAGDCETIGRRIQRRGEVKAWSREESRRVSFTSHKKTVEL
jgi:aryl-alcohol dehydrogenase-like predicted oxidoreductase